MNISSLDCLETVSEVPRVLGGSNFFRLSHFPIQTNKLFLLEAIEPEYQIYSISDTLVTDSGTTVELYSATGYSQADGTTFAYASSSVNSSGFHLEQIT